jgi:nitrate/nitrite-specific signal transduction histidine kinase
MRIAGLGLHIMGYRATALGGIFAITAVRPRGTAVTVDYACGDPEPAASGIHA